MENNNNLNSDNKDIIINAKQGEQPVHGNDNSKAKTGTNGKFLKGYAIALFSAAFILVGISVYIQYASAANLRDELASKEFVLNEDHPMVKNIQEINAHLQILLEEKTEELENKQKEYEESLSLQQQKQENLDILLEAQNQYIRGYRKKPRELLKTVEKNLLNVAEMEIYNYLDGKLN